MVKKEILVVTGMSGSGRTTVNQVLTDDGYIILENLNTNLLDKMMQVLIAEEKGQKIAIILNVRNLERFRRRLQLVMSYESDKVSIKRVMLTANESVLVNRYQETRKVHPLIKKDENISLHEAIRKEIEIVENINSDFNFVLDTSSLSANDTKSIIRNFINSETSDFRVNIQSFGFKYGIPIDSDLVFDVRFLKNPFYLPKLRVKTGMDKEVQEYVFSDQMAQRYYNNIYEVIETAIEGYKREGRLLVNISIGCTGGQHRSVTFVEKLVNDLNSEYVHSKHIEGMRNNWHK